MAKPRSHSLLHAVRSAITATDALLVHIFSYRPRLVSLYIEKECHALAKKPRDAAVIQIFVVFKVIQGRRFRYHQSKSRVRFPITIVIDIR